MNNPKTEIDSLLEPDSKKRTKKSHLLLGATAGLALLGAGLFVATKEDHRSDGKPIEILKDANGVSNFVVENMYKPEGVLLVEYSYDKEKTSPEVAEAYASVAKKLTDGKALFADAVVTLEDPAIGIRVAVYRPLVGGTDSGELIDDKAARPIFFSAQVSSTGAVTLKEIGDIDSNNLRVYSSGDARYEEFTLARKGPGLIDMNTGGKTLPSELVGITEQQVIEQQGTYLDVTDPTTGQSYAVGTLLVSNTK